MKLWNSQITQMELDKIKLPLIQLPTELWQWIPGNSDHSSHLSQLAPPNLQKPPRLHPFSCSFESPGRMSCPILLTNYWYTEPTCLVLFSQKPGQKSLLYNFLSYFSWDSEITPLFPHPVISFWNLHWQNQETIMEPDFSYQLLPLQ